MNESLSAIEALNYDMRCLERRVDDLEDDAKTRELPLMEPCCYCQAPIGDKERVHVLLCCRKLVHMSCLSAACASDMKSLHDLKPGSVVTLPFGVLKCPLCREVRGSAGSHKSIFFFIYIYILLQQSL